MYLNKSDIVTIASGHFPLTGAVGVGNETKLARSLVLNLIEKLKEKGYNVKNCTPPSGSYTVNSQLQKEVVLANSYSAKLHLCIHFNSGGGQGTEQWIYSGGGNAEIYAKQIQTEIVKATGYKNRGVKVSGNKLYIPRKTNAPCVLIEVAFVDSQSDMNMYNEEVVAKAIFKAITGADYNGNTTNNISSEASTTGTTKLSCGDMVGYNAILSGDNFFVRDTNGNKTGEMIPQNTKVKILDVGYSKQLCYLSVLVEGKEKKCYISNVPSCITYLYQGQYSNGSTKETAYETSSCKNDIGALDPYEKATPLYRENGILHIVYDTDRGKNTKSGYVKYNGGFSKL